VEYSHRSVMLEKHSPIGDRNRTFLLLQLLSFVAQFVSVAHIDYMTRLLPARSLHYIAVESKSGRRRAGVSVWTFNPYNKVATG